MSAAGSSDQVDRPGDEQADFDNGDLIDSESGYRFYQTFIDLCSLNDSRFNDTTLDIFLSQSSNDGVLPSNTRSIEEPLLDNPIPPHPKSISKSEPDSLPDTLSISQKTEKDLEELAERSDSVLSDFVSTTTKVSSLGTIHVDEKEEGDGKEEGGDKEEGDGKEEGGDKEEGDDRSERREDSEVTVAAMSREDKISMMKSIDFRKFLIKEIGRKFDLVEIMAQTLHRGVVKPQRLLVDESDYYVAIDLMTNTYYVCYRTLMMVDIDYYKEGCISRSIEDLMKIFEEYCARHPGLLFRIYKSRGGVHGFLVSHKSDYKTGEAITRMLDLDCDFYYSIYSYIRGWSVRLNRKKKDTTTQLYEYIGTVGDGVEDNHLGKLTDLHINLVSVFANVGYSTMAGI